MSTPFVPPFAEVIGDPIAQSKSPLIHGFWLDALGLAGRYARAQVKPEGLAASIAEPRAAPDWRACHNNMPPKHAIMALVAAPGATRGRTGADTPAVTQSGGGLHGPHPDAHANN